MFRIRRKGVPLVLILALVLVGSAFGGTAEASYSVNLSSLNISGGTLTQDQNNANYYYAEISSSSFTVTAIPVDSRSIVTVEGQTVTNGNGYVSQPVSMSAGSMKVVTIRVSSGSSSREYYIEAMRTGNTNVNLSSLSVSGGDLNPVFNRDTKAYSVNVGASTSRITLTAVPENSNANVIIAGQTVSSSSGWSKTISLYSDVSVIEVVVYASWGARNTYTLNVTRNPSIADLSSLSVSGGILDSSFSKNTSTYTCNVNPNTSSIRVIAVPEGNANVTVNGQTLNGSYSQPIYRSSGTTSIAVVVFNSVSSKTYNINVNWGSISSYLSSLSVGGGGLSPSFSKGTTSYKCNVNSNVASTTVAAAAEDSSATITVNGQTLGSSHISQPIYLSTGSNQITVIVSSSAGSTTYYINVTRGSTSSANLSSLSIGGGTLSPSFNKSTTSYSCNVSTNVASTTVAAVAEDSGATVTVNGQTLGSSHISQPINLNTGSNQITVIVSSSAGSMTYYINVTRGGYSNKAYLSSLSISNASLSPSFSQTTTHYTAYVYDESSVTVIAIPQDGGSTVSVNGYGVSYGLPSQAIYLGSRTTSIDIQVYNPSYGTNHYYIDVTRSGNYTNNVYLSNLYISGATLSPSFNQTTTNYTAYVYEYDSSITITAIPQDSSSTVTIEGQTVSYGSPSQTIYLGSGTNRVDIQVYNPSYGYMYYYIDVTRNGYYNNNSAYLSSLYINGAALDQSFYPSKTNYTATSNSSSVTVNASPEDSRSRVTVEGETLDYYDHVSRSIYLSSGVNRIDIQVYNPSSGEYTTYYIDVTRSGGGYGAIETNSATNISSNSATLNARISSNNSKRVEAYGFSYSTDQSNWKLVTVANGDFTGSYSKVLKNLQANTRYYYKAFMWNNNDYYTYGSTVSFYTTAANQGIEVPIVDVNTPNTISSFWDVPSNHWAYGHINNLIRLGYMTGYPDSSFHPGYGMSRAEIASVMVQILRINSYDTSTRHFYDVASNDWYFVAVEKAYQRGIISGPGGYFSPNRAVTREELAEVLVKALGKQSEAESNMSEDTGFYDDSSISSSARGYVVTAVRYGLITGYNNRFNPQNSITRAEVAAMLTTFLTKTR